jgi:hypothetical protein
MSSDVSIKEIVGIIFVILLIVFAVFYFGFSNGSNEVVENSVVDIEEEILVLQYVDVIQSGNLRNCQYIELQRERSACEFKLNQCIDDSCLYDKAVSEKSIQNCYEIIDDTLRTQCTSEVYRSSLFQEAVLTDSITVCDTILDDVTLQRCRDNYYFASSVNKNNLDLCESIIQEDLKNLCFQN